MPAQRPGCRTAVPAAAAGWRDPRRAIVGLAALHIGIFALALWATMIRQPFSDMLAWLGAFLQFRQHGGWLGYLLGFHNEHRLVWMRILAAVDAECLRSSGLPFIAAGTAALAISAALLTREVARAVSASGAHGALLWLCPMMFFTTANVIDCSVPINSVYPLALVFVVASCVLFDGAADAGPGTARRRGLAVLSAACAGFANAVGLLAWPMLLWVAWRGRAGRGWLALVGAVAGADTIAYVQGLPAGRPTSSLATAAHLAKMLGYLLAYLGLPLSRMHALALPGRLFGAAVLAAAICAVLRYGVFGRDVTRLQRIATGLILFSLGSAVLAALGRTDLAPEVDVPIRYAVLMTPLQAGLLALLLGWAVGDAARTHRGRRLHAGGAALAGLLLAQQIYGGLSAVAASSRMRATIARYYAGERDGQMTKVVYPDLAAADRIVAALRREGLLAD